MQTDYLYFMGAKLDMSQVIGIGPLIRTDGRDGGVPYCQLSFDLYLKHYPSRFDSGKEIEAPFLGLNEFRRQYNILSHGVDLYRDSGFVPRELRDPGSLAADQASDWVGISFFFQVAAGDVYEIMSRQEPDDRTCYLVTIGRVGASGQVLRAQRYYSDPPDSSAKARAVLSAYLIEKSIT